MKLFLFFFVEKRLFFFCKHKLITPECIFVKILFHLQLHLEKKNIIIDIKTLKQNFETKKIFL